MATDKNSKNQNLDIDILNAAFFVSNVNLSDKLDIASKISLGLKDVLDGDPTILPIPDDAPFELPRIILNSKNKLFSCSISPERIDFVINKSKMIATSEEVLDIEAEFLKNTKPLTTLIIKSLGWSVYRLALISQLKVKLTGGVVPFLQKMLTDNLGKDAKELQLHSLKMMKINDFEANHWLRLISQNAGTEEELLLIASDINTLQTEKYQVIEEDAEIFFEAALDATKQSVLKTL